MFGSKKSTEDVKATSPTSTSLTSTLQTAESSSFHSTKPTETENQKSKKRGLKNRAKEMYLRFEAHTPHGRDRGVMKMREVNGVRTEKLGEKIHDKVLFTQSAIWAMGLPMGNS
jgi:copper(I)-binding protein